jgi:hypothetical protein
MATPYAKGVLATGDLLPHLANQIAPEKPALEPHDFPMAYPFWAALHGAIITYVVNQWQVVEEPLATVEVSSSAWDKAVISGGEAGQTETAVEDVDAGTARVTK